MVGGLIFENLEPLLLLTLSFVLRDVMTALLRWGCRVGCCAFARSTRVRCAAILHHLYVHVPAASIALTRVVPEVLLLHLESDGKCTVSPATLELLSRKVAKVLIDGGSSCSRLEVFMRVVCNHFLAHASYLRWLLVPVTRSCWCLA